jgi:hypothetical protein
MPGEQTITFGLGVGLKTIKLNGDIAVHGDVSIIGNGEVTLDGAGKGRIFDVAEGARLALAGLTLVGGKADVGGAIRNAGDLTLVGVTLSGNHALQGGAIDNTGKLRVLGGTILDNAAVGPLAKGGGIANVGPKADATLVGTVVASNRADGPGSAGGGIANFGGGSLKVFFSLVLGNTANGKADGLYSGPGSNPRVFGSVVAGALTPPGGPFDVRGSKLLDGLGPDPLTDVFRR